MLRIALGVMAGFFAWAMVWFGSETILSYVWPSLSVRQAEFQEAIKPGGQFNADSTSLLTHIASLR